MDIRKCVLVVLFLTSFLINRYVINVPVSQRNRQAETVVSLLLNFPAVVYNILTWEIYVYRDRFRCFNDTTGTFQPHSHGWSIVP